MSEQPSSQAIDIPATRLDASVRSAKDLQIPWSPSTPLGMKLPPIHDLGSSRSNLHSPQASRPSTALDQRHPQTPTDNITGRHHQLPMTTVSSPTVQGTNGSPMARGYPNPPPLHSDSAFGTSPSYNNRRYSAATGGAPRTGSGFLSTTPQPPTPMGASPTADNRRQSMSNASQFGTRSPTIPFPHPPGYRPGDHSAPMGASGPGGVIPFPRMYPNYPSPSGPGQPVTPHPPGGMVTGSHYPGHPRPPQGYPRGADGLGYHHPGSALSSHVPPPYMHSVSGGPPTHSPARPAHPPFTTGMSGGHPMAHMGHPQPQMLPNLPHQNPMPPVPSSGLTDHWTDAEVDEILSYIKNNFQHWQQSKAVSYRRCREQLPNRTEKQIKNKVEKLISKYHKLCQWRASTTDPESSVRNWKWYTKLHGVFHSLDTTKGGNKGNRSGDASRATVGDKERKGVNEPKASEKSRKGEMGGELTRRHTTSSARPLTRARASRLASPSITAASSSLLALASGGNGSTQRDTNGGYPTAPLPGQSSLHPGYHPYDSENCPPLALPPITAFPRPPSDPQTARLRSSHHQATRLRSHSASVVGEHPSALRPRHYDRDGFSSGGSTHSHTPSPLSPYPPRPHGIYAPPPPAAMVSSMRPHGHTLIPQSSTVMTTMKHRDEHSTAPTSQLPAAVHNVVHQDDSHRPRRKSMPMPFSSQQVPLNATTGSYARPSLNADGVPVDSSGNPRPTTPQHGQRVSLSFFSDDTDSYYATQGPSRSGPAPPYGNTGGSGPIPFPMTPGRYSAYTQGQYPLRARAPPTGHHHRHRHSVYEMQTSHSAGLPQTLPGSAFARGPKQPPSGPSCGNAEAGTSSITMELDHPTKRRKSFYGQVRPALPTPDKPSESGDHSVGSTSHLGGVDMATTLSTPESSSGHPSPLDASVEGSSGTPVSFPGDLPKSRWGPRFSALTDQSLGEKRKRVISRGGPENIQRLMQDIHTSVSVDQPTDSRTRLEEEKGLSESTRGYFQTGPPPSQALLSSVQPSAKRLAIRRRAATVSDVSITNSRNVLPHPSVTRPTLGLVEAKGSRHYSHDASGAVLASRAAGVNELLHGSSPLTSLTSSPSSSQTRSPTAYPALDNKQREDGSVYYPQGHLTMLPANESLHREVTGSQDELLVKSGDYDIDSICTTAYCPHVQPFVSDLMDTVQELMNLKSQEIQLHQVLQQVLLKLKHHQLTDQTCDAYLPDTSTTYYDPSRSTSSSSTSLPSTVGDKGAPDAVHSRLGPESSGGAAGHVTGENPPEVMATDPSEDHTPCHPSSPSHSAGKYSYEQRSSSGDGHSAIAMDVENHETLHAALALVKQQASSAEGTLDNRVHFMNEDSAVTPSMGSATIDKTLSTPTERLKLEDTNGEVGGPDRTTHSTSPETLGDTTEDPLKENKGDDSMNEGRTLPVAKLQFTNSNSQGLEEFCGDTSKGTTGKNLEALSQSSPAGLEVMDS
ncbi:hypothetical protein IWQ61_002378 [Dispira simplex]|nr:hypothetical protein IWQ61_002378 [Dispira simplex]